MSKLGFGEAFRKYGAQLKNKQWSVCAEASNGSLVVSCWEHRLKSKDGVHRYEDILDRWKGPGNHEYRERLDLDFRSGQAIRAVIVSTDDITTVEAGMDAGKVKKKFWVKQEWIGKIVELDDHKVAIEFKRQSS